MRPVLLNLVIDLNAKAGGRLVVNVPLGVRSVSQARADRVAAAVHRLLANLEVDLDDCTCADFDPCPACGLKKAAI